MSTIKANDKEDAVLYKRFLSTTVIKNRKSNIIGTISLDSKIFRRNY